MAQVITEPENTHVVHHVENDSSSGSIIAVVGIALIVVIALIFFFYGLPMINRAATPTQVTVPVPDKVDVNLNQGQ